MGSLIDRQSGSTGQIRRERVSSADPRQLSGAARARTGNGRAASTITRRRGKPTEGKPTAYPGGTAPGRSAARDRPAPAAAPPRRLLQAPTANRRTWLIAANVSHDARFSSRCVRSGDRSPACSAIVHPFRRGSPLTSAPTYLPACSQASARASRTAAPQAARSVSGRPARPLCWQPQPQPPILLSSHTHNRQAAAPCRRATRHVRPPMGRVGDWRGSLGPVSSARLSNRACGSPAHGLPTFFTGGVRPSRASPGRAWAG